ncbi:LemA family protein [Enhygromyxa salina]|uniref:LemA family protein n=1 Tax=Enhygromyxa salina TaxID=215803 RepID=UPI001F0A5013|nr:LemA family protein [Enhygromyxa salina]
MVPSLVATDQGAAAHERVPLAAVTEARAKVGGLCTGASASLSSGRHARPSERHQRSAARATSG